MCNCGPRPKRGCHSRPRARRRPCLPPPAPTPRPAAPPTKRRPPTTSGDDVRRQPILDPLNLVPQHELALLQTRQLQCVPRILFLQRKNGAVERAMLFPKLDQPRPERALFGRVADVEFIVVAGAHAFAFAVR